MNFEKLEPEEIVFIHLLVEDILDTVNENIEKGGVSYIVDSPLGKIEVFGQFTEEQMKEITESTKVRLVRSIYEKFLPVYELIGEEGQDIIDKVRDELFPKEDGEEEEDM